MPLQIIRQDITKMKVDAIVNSTNPDMIGYSGVDYSIHCKAGPKLDKECKKKVPLCLGKAILTKGYNLDCRYVIHTAGPVWEGGTKCENEILKSCYVESLKLAFEKKCETVAFPLISSGTYGFPKDKVLKFAVSVITEFLFEHEMTVYLCVFDRESYEFSKKLFLEIKEFINDEESEVCAEAFRMPDMEREERCLRTYASMKRSIEKDVFMSLAPMSSETACGKKNKTLNEYMREMDKPFAYKLFDLIDKKGMTDVECYKKANIDKKTFSKIKCNPNKYRPSKQTAVAFAIALRLNLEETQDLLASAGMTLSQSFTFDKIILFFIQKGEYDIFEINEALFEFDQALLGCF